MRGRRRHIRSGACTPRRSSASSSWRSAAPAKVSLEPRMSARPSCRIGQFCVEAGEALRQREGVLGDEVRRALVVGLGQGVVEGVERQGKVPLGRLGDVDRARRAPSVRGLAQQRFDPHRLVEQVGTGLALEARETVEVEDVGRAAEVRQVGELQRRHRHLARRCPRTPPASGRRRGRPRAAARAPSRAPCRSGRAASARRRRGS